MDPDSREKNEEDRPDFFSILILSLRVVSSLNCQSTLRPTVSFQKQNIGNFHSTFQFSQLSWY